MDARPPGIWRLAAQPESDSISVKGAVVIFGLKVQQRFGRLKNHKWFFSIRGRCRQGTQAHRARAFASASTVSKDGDFKLGKSIGVSVGPSATRSSSQTRRAPEDSAAGGTLKSGVAVMLEQHRGSPMKQQAMELRVETHE